MNSNKFAARKRVENLEKHKEFNGSKHWLEIKFCQLLCDLTFLTLSQFLFLFSCFVYLFCKPKTDKPQKFNEKKNVHLIKCSDFCGFFSLFVVVVFIDVIFVIWNICLVLNMLPLFDWYFCFNSNQFSKKKTVKIKTHSNQNSPIRYVSLRKCICCVTTKKILSLVYRSQWQEKIGL